MSKQSNLDNFFKVSKSVDIIKKDIKQPIIEKKSEINNIFYMSWIDDKIEIQWFLDYLPDQYVVNFRGKLNWRKYKTNVTICGFIENQSLPILTGSKKYQLTFLKSLLQKAVRQQETDIAIKTCYQMFLNNPFETLRRIPIIMVEDVCVHESLPIVIWLMCAIGCKNIEVGKIDIQKHHVEYILGLIKTICETNRADHFQFKENIKDIKRYQDLTKVDNNTMNILYSIALRESYGGLVQDNKMLNFCCDNWFEIKSDPKKNLDFLRTEITPYKLTDDLDLTKKDWMFCSIDFHCYPKMLVTINKKHPKYTKEEIQKCIWNMSSKTNYRKSNDDRGYSEMWNEISEDVRNIQKYIINRIY